MKMSLNIQIKPKSKYSRQNVATIAKIKEGRPGLLICLRHLLQENNVKMIVKVMATTE